MNSRPKMGADALGLARLGSVVNGQDSRRMPRTVCLILLTVVGIAGAGCGTTADRDQARAAAERLYRAVAAGDGQIACTQMSPSLRAALVDDAQRCAKAVLDLDLTGREPVAVRVYATSAEVRFDHGDTVFLDDTAEGWRVDALGCKPQRKGPFDCEAQA